jgi:hypothetical protein
LMNSMPVASSDLPGVGAAGAGAAAGTGMSRGSSTGSSERSSSVGRDAASMPAI